MYFARVSNDPWPQADGVDRRGIQPEAMLTITSFIIHHPDSGMTARINAECEGEE
jgi:hypothetical protein